ncbi:hypothetical protein [Mycobacterium arosiense]|nr:hypothetical protein [Mycobacterium arosiense]
MKPTIFYPFGLGATGPQATATGLHSVGKPPHEPKGYISQSG